MIEGLTYGQNGIDDTEYNQLCWSCHNGGMAINTHSSVQTDNGYGNWTVECRVCHNPHGHKQFRTYGSASYLYQGTVSLVDATTLTKTGAGWTDNQYQDLILIPNTAQTAYNYKITGNTSDTLTVEGTINLTKVSPGNTFIIVYRGLIREKVVTPSSGTKSVRFFNTTGTNSFADGNATYDGVCEVCHTLTTFHKNDATGDHTHNAGADCTTCHKHTIGFKVACNTCHGYPPVVNTATGGPDGLVNNPGVTNSSIAGAHNVHVNTKSYDCTVCHYNSSGSGSTHNNALTVTMGFYMINGNRQGGSYDGQSGVSYNTTTTSPVTSVSNNGNKTCSNIYCHSTGQSTTNSNSSTPTYASPIWDTPASGACGTCHKVTEASGLTSGSHGAHLGTTGVSGCGNCHTGAANDASSYNSANHINASIDVANSYTAGGTPGNGYGTCSTASCHDDATGNLLTTPTWGVPGAGCSECHAEVPNSGNHTKHVTTTLYSTAACGDCHDSAVQGATPPEQHLDSNIDVYDSSAGDLGYTADKAKGSAYTTCTTAYCHSTGQSTSDGNSATPTYATVTWGDSAVCGTCHKVTEASGLTSGSHAAHLGTTGVNGCSDCHTGAANDASSYNSTSHVNKSIDVANSYTKGGTPGNGYGTCSAASCHDDGTGNPAVTPTWGASAAACTACHAAAPATGSHTKHLSGTQYSTALCENCHDGAVQGTTAPEQHLDGNVDVYDSAAGDLGYPQNVAKGGAPYDNCSTAYCHSSGQSTTNANSATPNYATVTWGDSAACGTCHDVTELAGLTSGSHAAHLGTSGVNGCGDCHTGAANNSSAYNSTNHVNGSIDVSNSYTKGGTPGNGYGTCSTASCHSDGLGNYKTTPTWGSAGSGCGTCHDALPTSGAHSKHVKTSATAYGSTSVSTTGGNNDFGCGNCHPVSASKHRNGVLDITLNKTHGGTLKTRNNVTNDTSGYSQTTGVSVTCSATYCHSKGDGTFTITSPDWYATYNGDTCGHCHGNSPVTGSHSAHVVGIHYNNVYTGTTGLTKDVDNNNNAHGNASTSTTINCNICHNGTVTSSANDKNIVCAQCHGVGSIALQGNAAIAVGSTTHLNGAVNVSFANITVRSKAQIRNDITTVSDVNTYWQRNNGYKAGASSHDSSKATLGSTASYSSGSCSSVACHNGNTIIWGDTGVSCNTCHTALP